MDAKREVDLKLRAQLLPELYDTKSKPFDRLIYSTSKLDAEKDNPFKCN